MFIYRQNPPSRLIKPKAARDDRLDSAIGIRVLPDLSVGEAGGTLGQSVVAVEDEDVGRNQGRNHGSATGEQGFKRSRKSPATGPTKTQQVLAMFAKGKSRAEIALALGVDRGAVIGIVWRSRNRERVLGYKRKNRQQARQRGASP